MGRRAAAPGDAPATSLPLGLEPKGEDAAAPAATPDDTAPADPQPSDPVTPDQDDADPGEDSAGADEPTAPDVEPLPTPEPVKDSQGIGRVTTLEEMYKKSQGLVHNPFTSY